MKKEWYGASSSLHQRFQDWNEAGVWKKVYRVMVKYYHTKRHIRWQWQAVDSKMVPAPLGGDGTGHNLGSSQWVYKRHLWVDQRGAPLSVHITPANAHDVTAILDLLNHPIVRRPKTQYRVHHLCADKAYDSEPLRTKLRQRRFILHICKREYDQTRCLLLWKPRNILLGVGWWNERHPGKTTSALCVFVGPRSPATG